ncbi:MAG TPA: CAP domain-containing protein [Ktedonobacteraceae bacterium]|nr:CAP domain-containing protein [Ktedonobacteraceae bacterium]
MALLTACGAGQASKGVPVQPITGDSLSIAQQQAPSPPITIPRQIVKPSSTPTQPSKPAQTYHPSAPPTNIPSTGTGAAPWGAPPALTAEETQLTQQLFNQMNQDRAARGLYAFVWNATLAGGARLHSWNMYHCGFSHTCPDGLDQCTRIANEGFAGYTDCGENIGLAGPSNPPWANIYAVQESMINEPPSGWHRIHLTSTTLHRVGVGIYIDPGGWAWFTEDMVS